MQLKKKKKFKTQNDKVWTLNFSSPKFVKQAMVIVPVLKKKVKLKSMGLTIMMAAEFCMQDSVLDKFKEYVSSNKKMLEG